MTRQPIGPRPLVLAGGVSATAGLALVALVREPVALTTGLVLAALALAATASALASAARPRAAARRGGAASARGARRGDVSASARIALRRDGVPGDIPPAPAGASYPYSSRTRTDRQVTQPSSFSNSEMSVGTGV